MKFTQSLFLTFLFLTIFLKSCNSEFKHQNSLTITPKDSINLWINNSRTKTLKNSKKKILLNKSLEKLKFYKNTDYKAKKLSEIAYRFYEINDTLNFKKINDEALELALKVKDTFTIADVNWSNAEFYYNKTNYPKAYYYYNNALQHFNSINKEYECGRMLLKMSTIKGFYRDYTGSEIFLFKAIKIFRELKDERLKNKLQAFCYHNLGLIQVDIKQFDKSIFYYNKSSEFRVKFDKNNKYLPNLLNGLGFAYYSKKKHKKAIEYFDRGLKLFNGEIVFDKDFPYLLSNKAMAKLAILDTFNIKANLYISLKIRDSINHKEGIVDSKVKLSKYFSHFKDTLQSIKYAKEANLMSKKINNGIQYLKSLKILSELDIKNSKKHLNRYIQFNDSLISVERKTQNKFTRIEFETDEIKEESERLSRQQIWILTSSVSLVLILSLIYFLRVQKAKNEKLILETEQQKANEQVYVLTLKQQAILEEEKVQERNRISQELHDGVLGRLFGTRVGLGFLDISDDETTQEQHQTFLNELQDIEKEIRDVSHKLNNDFDSSEVNFKSIINQLLKEKSVIGNFKYNLDIDKNITWKNVNEIIKVNVYRIIQESLQNIIKHANATNVTLKFIEENNQLKIAIEDDGVGFNTSKSKKGIGLKNIKSRIKKINGTLGIFSEKNKGTTLQINILLT